MSKNKPHFELGRDPFTGQFASMKDIFPQHQQEEVEPEHLEWRAPEPDASFRNHYPSPEEILIAMETESRNFSEDLREAVESTLAYYRGDEEEVMESYDYDYQGSNHYDVDACNEEDYLQEDDKPHPAEELQEKMDLEIVSNEIRRQNARYDELPWDGQDGNRQLPSRRRAQEKRIGRQIKYRNAA